MKVHGRYITCGVVILLHTLFNLVYAAESVRNDVQEALVNAAAQGDVAHVQRLIGQSVDLNATSQEANFATALVQASANGHNGVVSALLKAGASADGLDGRSQRPLTVASYHGRVDVCRQLLIAGAKPQALAQDNVSPIIAAAMGGNVAIVELLLVNGAVVAATDREGRNPLVIAARSGNLPVVVALLKFFAKEESDPNSVALLKLAAGEARLSQHGAVAALLARSVTP